MRERGHVAQSIGIQVEPDELPVFGVGEGACNRVIEMKSIGMTH